MFTLNKMEKMTTLIRKYTGKHYFSLGWYGVDTRKTIKNEKIILLLMISTLIVFSLTKSSYIFALSRSFHVQNEGPSFSVSPLTIRMGLLEKGNTYTFSFIVNNTGDKDITIKITPDLATANTTDWLRLEQSQLRLAIGEFKNVSGSISLPATAAVGSYFYLLSVALVNENDNQIGLGVALTVTILYAIKGLLFDVSVTDSVPQEDLPVVVSLHNYERQKIVSFTQIKVFQGESLVFEDTGKNLTIESFGNNGSAVTNFIGQWMFNLNTTLWSGTYLLWVKYFYYFAENESYEDARTYLIQKPFLVGTIKGSVSVDVVFPKKTFEPVVITFTIHNEGTLPLGVLINASLREEATNQSYGNVQNYYTSVDPLTTKEEKFVIIPEIVGNYSLILEYSYAGKKERTIQQLSIVTEGTLPINGGTLTSSKNGNFIPALTSTQPPNLLLSLVFLAIGILLGVSGNVLLYKKKFRQSNIQQTQSARSRPAKILAWLVLRPDGTDLYGRNFATIDEFKTTLLSGLLSSIIITINNFTTETPVFQERVALKRFDFGNYQTLIHYGRYIWSILFLTRGDITQLEDVQKEIVQYIESQSQDMFTQRRLIDSAELGEIWLHCEEMLRPYLY